jgi:hypothetical protein
VYAAPEGGSIHVAPGTYAESIEVYGKGVTIVGDDAATTIVTGAAGKATFTVGSDAKASLTRLTLTHPANTTGPGLYNHSPSTVLTSVVVSGNAVSGSGGGIVNWGVVSLERSSVAANAASENGAGIVNGGTLLVSESTVHGNLAGVAGLGGGIYNTGTLKVTRSTIDANSASGGGGVASFFATTPAVFETATVSDNNADSGGGIAVGGGALNLTGVTLAGNRAPLGANLYADGASVTTSGSIVAGSSGANCFFFGAALISGGHNLDSGASCGFAGSGDLTNTDPKLGALDANGGPTRTRALLAGSAAIDAAGSSCLAVDQRGIGRPQRAACDIGAFEAGPDPVVTVTTPADGALFAVGQAVSAAYGCADKLMAGPIASCVGTVAVGAPLDTSTIGSRTFTVTGTDRYGFSTVARANFTVVNAITMGPQAMEGDLKLAPGTVLKAGYDFTLPGSHPQVITAVVGARVLFTAGCATGSGGGAFTVPMPDSRTTVPAGSSGWYPSGDQKSPLVFQGSIVVPDLCHGGIVRLNQGGKFVAGFGSSDGKTKTNVRWHYSASGSAGGWSGTASIIPTLVG